MTHTPSGALLIRRLTRSEAYMLALSMHHERLTADWSFTTESEFQDRYAALRRDLIHVVKILEIEIPGAKI